jgi:hypothetical protein
MATINSNSSEMWEILLADYTKTAIDPQHIYNSSSNERGVIYETINIKTLTKKEIDKAIKNAVKSNQSR